MSQQQYPDRCDCDAPVDDGAGISWTVSLDPGASATFSHLTLFSPAGRRAVTTTLTADDATPQSGAIVQFTALVQNPVGTPLELNGLHATLPLGFQYVSNSTIGAVTADPTINGTHLSWNSPLTVASNGQLQFGFAARVSGNASTSSVTAGVDPADPTTTATDGTAAVTVAGGGVAQQPLRSSVPSPTQINLNPQVVAQTVIITASVVVLIPFPSALFNATLEQNYDEITAGLGRLRRRLTKPFKRRTPATPPKPERISATTEAGSEEGGTDDGETVQATTAEAVATIEGATVDAPAHTAPVDVEAEVDPAAFEPDHGPRPNFWATIPGVALFMVVSALLYCLLDPTFGFNLHSLATFAGVLGGLGVLLLAFGLAFDREMHKRAVVSFHGRYLERSWSASRACWSRDWRRSSPATCTGSSSASSSRASWPRRKRAGEWPSRPPGSWSPPGPRGCC